MRRFETTDQWWEIEVVVANTCQRWGKLGTRSVKSSNRSWGSEEKAAKEMEKLIAAKVAKGFAEVGAAKPASAKKTVAPETKKKPAPKKGKAMTKPVSRTFTFVGGEKAASSYEGRKKQREETMEQYVARLGEMLDADGESLASLTIGDWPLINEGAGVEPIVAALVARKDGLTGLRSVFFGEISGEHCEPSWVQPGSVDALWPAFPLLEEFRCTGSPRLGKELRHDRLKKIVIECSGLGKDVARLLAASKLPALEHLELYLGIPDYGRTTEVDDLTPILSGKLFPKLRYLGLENADNEDEIAAAVAAAPVLERLSVLDLSRGTLGDEGARALLASPGVKKLEKLVLDHHFVSEELIAELRELGPELVESAEERDEDRIGGSGDGRYVSMAE